MLFGVINIDIVKSRKVKDRAALQRKLNKYIKILNDKFIGILERIVIIFAVATDMTNIIGFLIAAKSIARFKKFDDDSFVEYFIIGSFLSIFIAVIIGLAIRQLNILPH